MRILSLGGAASGRLDPDPSSLILIGVFPAAAIRAGATRFDAMMAADGAAGDAATRRAKLRPFSTGSNLLSIPVRPRQLSLAPGAASISASPRSMGKPVLSTRDPWSGLPADDPSLMTSSLSFAFFSFGLLFGVIAAGARAVNRWPEHADLDTRP